MAAEFKHSKELFKFADGSTMVFFMRPCSQRQELRPLIESGGGKVTSKVIKGSIKLAEKGSVVSANDYIEAKYIKDCVNQNKLLPMDSYRVQSGSRVRNESGNSNVSIQSFGSSDSLSPASYIVQTSARDYKGRSKYTKEDDIAMITFLIEEKRYSEALGLRVWKDMEMRKITSHSASSMNTRYRKHILPNLEKYKFDVDRRWIAKLAGGVVGKETEPEFSAEALFTLSKKSTKAERTKRKVDLTNQVFGDDFDFASSVESSEEVEIISESPNTNEIELKKPKKQEIGNKHVTKDSKKSDENGDMIEHDCTEENKENGIHGDKRNNKKRGSKRSKTSESTEEHEQDITFDEDKLKRKLDSEKSSILEEDKIVPPERRDEVDGDPEVSGEFDKTSQLNSKGSKDSKGKNQSDLKSKSDTNDGTVTDDLEYLDAECNSPSDIFVITDEENNLLVKDGAVKHDRHEKKKSVVNMDDGRLTLSQESDDSIYYDFEEYPDVKCDKQNKNMIELRIPNPLKNHCNTSNNAINSKAQSACKNSKDQGPDKSIKQQGTEKNCIDPGSDGDGKFTDKNVKKKDSKKCDKEPDSTEGSKQQDTDKHGSDKGKHKQSDKNGKGQSSSKDGKQQASERSGKEKKLDKQQGTDNDKSGKDKGSDKGGKHQDADEIGKGKQGSSKSGKQTAIDITDIEQESDIFDKQEGTDKNGKGKCSDKVGKLQDAGKSGKEHGLDNKDKRLGRNRQKLDITETFSGAKDNNSARDETKILRKDSSPVDENAETQSPEVEICSNEVTSSGQFMELSDNSGHVELLRESDIESDSFDEMLENYIKEKSVMVMNVRKADATDGPRGKRKRENDKDSTDSSSRREEKKRKLVAECRATIKTISDKYGLSERFVRQLLFQCSSDVDRLVSYIEYGPHSSELPPWTDLDDNILKSDPRAVSLILKFGEQDVKNRYNFMNYIT